MKNKVIGIIKLSPIGVSLTISATSLILLSCSLFVLIDSFGVKTDIHQCTMIVATVISLGSISLEEENANNLRRLAVKRFSFAVISFLIASIRVLIYW